MDASTSMQEKIAVQADCVTIFVQRYPGLQNPLGSNTPETRQLAARARRSSILPNLASVLSVANSLIAEARTICFLCSMPQSFVEVSLESQLLSGWTCTSTIESLHHRVSIDTIANSSRASSSLKATMASFVSVGRNLDLFRWVCRFSQGLNSGAYRDWMPKRRH